MQRLKKISILICLEAYARDLDMDFPRSTQEKSRAE